MEAGESTDPRNPLAPTWGTSVGGRIADAWFLARVLHNPASKSDVHRVV